MRSGRNGAVSRGPCTVRRTTTTAITTASTPNSPPAPASTITTPASAGPTARATLTETFVIATAATSSRRGTRSGTVAENAGRNIASPAPSAAVKTRTTAGVAAPATVNTANTIIDTVIARLAATSSRRRSTTSATAPANNESTTPGTLIAVWISDTNAAESDSLVMTSTAPTVCAQMTICAAMNANHATRKRASRKGASAETAGRSMVTARTLAIPRPRHPGRRLLVAAGAHACPREAAERTRRGDRHAVPASKSVKSSCRAKASRRRRRGCARLHRWPSSVLAAGAFGLLGGRHGGGHGLMCFGADADGDVAGSAGTDDGEGAAIEGRAVGAAEGLLGPRV